jgi:hypothetical protein
MSFDPTQYGPDVARILALGGNGERLMPLRCGDCVNDEARRLLKTFKPGDLFPNQEEPEAPMAALWLYFSCFEEAHSLVEKCETTEGELWHAILHRQEPDSGNAAYWFRKAGTHPAFPQIAQAAVKVLHRIPKAEFRTGKWDPFAFVAFCDRAREQPDSPQMQAAIEIQRAEWQVMFDYCARLSK